MDAERGGGCACGTVRYRMTASPMIVHCCHCRSCQIETGSAFAVNALVETAALRIDAGVPEAVSIPADSGTDQRILRCPICRVALWSHYAGAGDAIAFVRVGTLDTPADCPPDVHIYTRSRLPWIAPAADTAGFEAYYSPRQVWSAEAQRRWKATRAG